MTAGSVGLQAKEPMPPLAVTSQPTGLRLLIGHETGDPVNKVTCGRVGLGAFCEAGEIAPVRDMDIWDGPHQDTLKE